MLSLCYDGGSVAGLDGSCLLSSLRQQQAAAARSLRGGKFGTFNNTVFPVLNEKQIMTIYNLLYVRRTVFFDLGATLSSARICYPRAIRAPTDIK